jgi:hypothetical protein
MSVEEFEQWLNQEILDLEEMIRVDKANHYNTDLLVIQKQTYEVVLSQYKKVMPPPTTLN